MKKADLTSRILRFTLFSMLVSRGILYIFKTSPWRNLFWYEALFSPVVEFFGTDWVHYGNTSDPYILVWEKIIGLFLISCGFICLFIKAGQPQKILKNCLIICGFFTVFHAILEFWGRNHEIPMLIEYLLQGGALWLFIGLLKYMPANENEKWQVPDPRVSQWLRLLLSSCFLGHGLYAAGFPYQPVTFVEMLQAVLPLEFETLFLIVKFIGWMDITLAILIFIKPFEKVTLLHMAVWGLITAGARVMAYVIMPMDFSAFNPWFFQTTVRLVHGLLPLVYWFILEQLSEEKTPDFVTEIKYTCRHSLPLNLAAALAIGFIIFYMPPLPKSSTEKFVAKNNIDRSDISLKLSPKGFLYSDNILHNDFYLVRLISKDNKSDMQTCEHIHRQKKRILTNINKTILESFHDSPMANSKYTEENILKFVSKAYVTFKNSTDIKAEIHVPWVKGKVIQAHFSLGQEDSI